MSLLWDSNLDLPKLMDSNLALVTAFVGASALAVALYKWSSKSSDTINGPRIYPLIGCLPEFLRNSARRHDWVTDYIKKSPKLNMRYKYAHFGTIIVTANPMNVEYILKTNFSNYPKGEKLNVVFRPLLGYGIFNIDGPMWKTQRKVASHEFSAKTLRDFLVDALRKGTSARLLPFLSKAATEGTTIDLQEIFMRFGFDNICLIGFGVDTGCMEISLPRVKFADAFDEAAELCVSRFLLPSFLAGSTNRKLKEAVRVVDDFAMSVISSRRKELSNREGTGSKGDSRSDLLSRFIQLAEQDSEGRNQKETDIYIRDMIVNFLLAGRDTSAGVLSFFFWILSSHPEVEAKILAEIVSITSGRHSSDSRKQATANDPLSREGFTYDELKQMNYLHAALTETLRLYPSVPSDTKTCQADDVWPDGTVIRKYDRVGYHPYSMGRLEALWGKDCLEYKPERWLSSTGTFVQENPFKFAAFQAGPRICLGKDMAIIQMKYVAASIISSPFKVNVLPGQTDEYGMSLTLRLKNGLLCKVSHAH